MVTLFRTLSHVYHFLAGIAGDGYRLVAKFKRAGQQWLALADIEAFFGFHPLYQFIAGQQDAVSKGWTAAFVHSHQGNFAIGRLPHSFHDTIKFFGCHKRFFSTSA